MRLVDFYFGGQLQLIPSYWEKQVKQITQNLDEMDLMCDIMDDYFQPCSPQEYESIQKNDTHIVNYCPIDSITVNISKPIRENFECYEDWVCAVKKYNTLYEVIKTCNWDECNNNVVNDVNDNEILDDLGSTTLAPFNLHDKSHEELIEMIYDEGLENNIDLNTATRSELIDFLCVNYPDVHNYHINVSKNGMVF
jgi:hypothetical protein